MEITVPVVSVALLLIRLLCNQVLLNQSSKIKLRSVCVRVIMCSWHVIKLRSVCVRVIMCSWRTLDMWWKLQIKETEDVLFACVVLLWLCVCVCVRAWVTWVIVGRWIWKYIYYIPGPKVINRTISDNGACSHNVNSFCLSKPYITLPNIALNVRGRININTPNTCNVSPQSTIKALSFI